MATACSTAPRAPSAGPPRPPSAGPRPPAVAGALTRRALTIWHSYGSGAGTEATALKTVTDKIQAANPDLKLTIQDIKFDDLFKKFELEAASGGGPDLFIAPNDSLGKEARAGLFLDVDLAGKLDGNDSQVSVDGSKVDGKLYMVPESLKAVAMYYDKCQGRDPAGDDRCAARRRQGRHDQGRASTPTPPTTRSAGGPPSAASSWTAAASASPTRPASPTPTSTSRTSRRPAPSGTTSTTTSPATSRPARSTSSSTARGPRAATRTPSRTTSRSRRCRPVRPARRSR